MKLIQYPTYILKIHKSLKNCLIDKNYTIFRKENAWIFQIQSQKWVYTLLKWQKMALIPKHGLKWPKITFKWPLGALGGESWPLITKITVSPDSLTSKTPENLYHRLFWFFFVFSVIFIIFHIFFDPWAENVQE